MSANPETITSSILRTRIGVMTSLAPTISLTNDEILGELHKVVDRCVIDREVQLVVDLSSARVINSAAMEMLLDIQDQLVRLGGWLKVAHISPIIKDIFLVTGFTEYVTIVGTESPDPHPVTSRRKKLGDILVARGLITEERIAEAMRLQKRLSKRMGQIIIEKGWVSEQDVLLGLGEQLSIPFIKLRAGIYDPEIVDLLDKDTARRLRVLPLQRVRGVLTLATADPQAIPSFDEVQERTGCRVRPVLARREEILNNLSDSYAGHIDTAELLGDVDDDFAVIESIIPDDYSAIDEMAEGSPIINLVNSIVQRAVRDGASDIHIEPARAKSRVRYRIDGVLYEVTTLRPELHPAVISRLKVMANLDIAERRMPQDGRIQVQTQGRSVDLRFSSLPGLFGEKVVLRVLDKNHALLDVSKLGMVEENAVRFRELLDRSYGLILATGPTGSGKTTSLYAALNYLNSIEKNIVTIEDPVEYQLDIINQNEVREKIGLGFAKVLKHTLRQDPDIIMVGEIRDRETAEIAVQAALTGHLVLSSLHTSHAIGAITRLIDMGIEPYLLSSALIGVVAQRLVRTICPACKTRHVATPELVQRYGWEKDSQVQLARGRGCPECYDSGYRGRMGIHEILSADEDLQRLVTSNPSRDELKKYMDDRNIRTLFDDGLEHVRRGETTIEEISRVINA